MSLKRSIFIAIIACCSGCSQLAYYSQAVKGQWQIVNNRQPIEALIEDTTTPAELRKRLEFVREVRNFASTELGLPDNKTFRYYSDLGRSHVVWNVIATPQFNVQPKTWCFPVAGCVAYKGYFSEEDAALLEQSLIKQGFDTFSYGVGAYSTLGWFTDPVLNTFINYSDLSLVGLIFHELAHQVVYVKNDSAFNEAFATAVEYAGVEKWIEQNLTADQVIDYRQRRDNQTAINNMVLEFRKELAQLYEDKAESPNLAELKLQRFSQLRLRYEEVKKNNKNTPYYDWWFKQELNNAHLTALATYHDLVPGFLKQLKQSTSFKSFYEIVSEIAKRDKKERDHWLKQ